MYSYNSVNRQRRRPAPMKKLYKPKILYTADGFAVTTLYLKSVKEVRRDQLLSHFSTFGKVQNVRIHTKPTFAFGFVTFARAESAAKALNERVHKIAGREIIVVVADSWHQEKPLELSNNHKAAAAKVKRAVKVPIELTNLTGTHILSLPDDCLYEMFSLKLIDIMDLCALAETCTRLKDIATRIFATSHKICDLKEMSLRTIYETRRVLINFGSSITELSLQSSYEDGGYDDDAVSARVLDLVVRYCSKTLESLKLQDYEITNLLTGKLRPLFSNLKTLHIVDSYIYGDGGKQLFSNCKSLVELKVIDLQNDDTGLIFGNRFPKLQRFKCQSLSDDYNLDSFLTRHKGLKAFSIKEYQHDCSSLLPMIAEHLKDLEKLQITGHTGDGSSLKVVDAMMSLLTLKKLTKLKIKCDEANVTKFIRELPQLSSLEFLELWHAQSNTEFIPALAQLKNLNVLRLRQCNDLKNLDPLADLEKLTELSIMLRSPSVHVIEFDVVAMIKRLVNLKKLTIGLDTFKLDKRMYLKIVNVVRQRTSRSPPSSLEILAYKIEDEVADLQRDGKNEEVVKLDKVYYSGSDVEYSESDSDYDFDDDDDDDSDASFNWNHAAALLFPFLPPHLFPGYDDSDNDSGDVDYGVDENDEESEVW